jgi:hypothetical protein
MRISSATGAFDTPHPIPKPDQFALFLGIHVVHL